MFSDLVHGYSLTAECRCFLYCFFSQIFIDYGEDWEKAWNDHLTTWKSPCDDLSNLAECFESSQRITQMNEDKHNKAFHQFSNVHLTACNRTIPDLWNGEVALLAQPGTIDSTSDYHVREEFYGITSDDEGFHYPDLPHFQVTTCQVVDSHPEKDTFDVIYFFDPRRVYNRNYYHLLTPNVKGVAVLYKDLPASQIHYFNKPLTNDWHYPSAFRHEIHIPDDEFPTLWKDLLKERPTTDDLDVSIDITDVVNNTQEEDKTNKGYSTNSETTDLKSRYTKIGESL